MVRLKRSLLFITMLAIAMLACVKGYLVVKAQHRKGSVLVDIKVPLKPATGRTYFIRGPACVRVSRVMLTQPREGLLQLITETQAPIPKEANFLLFATFGTKPRALYNTWVSYAYNCSYNHAFFSLKPGMAVVMRNHKTGIKRIGKAHASVVGSKITLTFERRLVGSRSLRSVMVAQGSNGSYVRADNQPVPNCMWWP